MTNDKLTQAVEDAVGVDELRALNLSPEAVRHLVALCPPWMTLSKFVMFILARYDEERVRGEISIRSDRRASMTISAAMTPDWRVRGLWVDTQHLGDGDLEAKLVAKQLRAFADKLERVK